MPLKKQKLRFLRAKNKNSFSSRRFQSRFSYRAILQEYYSLSPQDEKRLFHCKEKIDIFRTTDFVDEIREVMTKKRTRDFPILDTKGKYRGMISRRNLLDMKKKQVILVDHNEKSQAAEGVENTEILEIIDHHRLGTMETMSPVFFRNQPLGCTATIIYQMYREYQVDISKMMAGLLCSAILSDTLMRISRQLSIWPRLRESMWKPMQMKCFWRQVTLAIRRRRKSSSRILKSSLPRM